MKATETKLLAFLKKSSQFIIPIYQRTYSWTENECLQLWDDIVRTGGNDKITTHFVGSVVYVEAGLSQVSDQSPLLVIDGQQRLTTITILLAVLADTLGDREPADGFSARKLRHYYLVNPEESGERHHKLLLTQTDKNSLLSIVDGCEPPLEPSLLIERAHKLLKRKIAERGEDLIPVCKGLAKLAIVDIALNRDQDNPQLIFESMNSTGRRLSQADLIRNFILMGLEPKLQTRLYEQYWRRMEVEFGQKAYGAHFDGFMRHYLTMKSETRRIPRLDDVYEAFKEHAGLPEIAAAGVESLIKDVLKFARYFCAMALDAEDQPDLRLAFRDIRGLKVDVAYPLLLELYQDYAENRLTRDEFLEVVRLIEAYVFRRAICEIPTNSLNKTFPAFTRSVDKDRYLNSVKANFLRMSSYRRFPDDSEFCRAIQIRDLYNSRNRSYWLRRFENHGRKESVLTDELTVEHIMPQGKPLPDAWKASLGDDWERVHEKYCHTLGNLTLTAYNSEYGNRSFADKRDMENGFKYSPLKLNEGLGEVVNWNEGEIVKRAERLSERAAKVWRAPSPHDVDLSDYESSADEAPAYSIEDHKFLLSSPTREIFAALRKEILALDALVTEEFLRNYVAYRAETNFVDVIPQKSRLRVVFNMSFSDIIDLRGICKDISDVSHQGNGDVDVYLEDIEDVPYIVGLARQSLEQQLGGEGSE
ncbi:MAG: DUF262 and DUF1524 domain-containing protein [Pirellulales bacterium]|nr:DUF262 and DUF1524 domain-containing protein [Alphaproteobacteria bacterium]MDA8041507.1 DUF262 and DUF1524 domain-containing protein [Pirellulales bacterium]